jgi:hypothetical protein
MRIEAVRMPNGDMRERGGFGRTWHCSNGPGGAIGLPADGAVHWGMTP